MEVLKYEGLTQDSSEVVMDSTEENRSRCRDISLSFSIEKLASPGPFLRCMN